MEVLTVAEAMRYAVVRQYREGKLSLEEACGRLGVHRVTMWRAVQRLAEHGPKGLIHQLRGRPSNFAPDPRLRRFVCTLFDQEYRRFGFRVAHFYQDAAHRFPRCVGYSTVVRWLKEEKLIERVHTGWRHHSRRPRREAFGELLQMDTSIHDWLGWKKNVALIAAIDDATNLVCGAHLALSDTTLANMTVLKNVIASYGLFASLYVDKSPIFKVTRTGGIGRIVQPTRKAPYITQMKRALTDLRIELIYAHSPQAKGRIERCFSTWQHRLIPELRKRGITDLDKANHFIHHRFLPQFNERFSDNPARYRNVFVAPKHIDLNFILAEHYPLTVGNDHIVTSKQAGLTLKVLPSTYRQSYAKAKVDVFKHTDGSISIRYKDQSLTFVEV